MSHSVTRRSGSPDTLVTLPETDAFSLERGGWARQKAVRIIPRPASFLTLPGTILSWCLGDGLQENLVHQLDRIA